MGLYCICTCNIHGECSLNRAQATAIILKVARQDYDVRSYESVGG